MAISADSIDKSKTLASKLGLSFPVLSDPDLEVTKKYGVADEENRIAWPAVFILGADGRIAWRTISETYKRRPEPLELLTQLEKLRSSPQGH